MFRRAQQLLVQLRRRRVMRTTGVYLVGLWLLSQGIADLFPAFGLPDWTVRTVVILGLLATPLVALLSWKYDITPKGVEVDDGAGFDDTLVSSDGELPGNMGSVLVTWVDDSDQPRKRRLRHRFIIGRDGDIELLDKRVSRRHAEVYHKQQTWRIRDLASANGTYVDGTRIDDVELPARASVRCHRRGPELQIEVSAPAPSEAE